MSEQKPTEEEIVQAVYALAAEQMKNGASSQQIQSMLVEKGIDQESAATVVSNLARMRSEAIREASKKNCSTVRSGALAESSSPLQPIALRRVAVSTSSHGEQFCLVRFSFSVDSSSRAVTNAQVVV